MRLSCHSEPRRPLQIYNGIRPFPEAVPCIRGGHQGRFAAPGSDPAKLVNSGRRKFEIEELQVRGQIPPSSLVAAAAAAGNCQTRYLNFCSSDVAYDCGRLDRSIS